MYCVASHNTYNAAKAAVARYTHHAIACSINILYWNITMSEKKKKTAMWSTAEYSGLFALGNGSLLDLGMQQVNAEHFTNY